jgi:hypothetical protein
VHHFLAYGREASIRTRPFYCAYTGQFYCRTTTRSPASFAELVIELPFPNRSAKKSAYCQLSGLAQAMTCLSRKPMLIQLFDPNGGLAPILTRNARRHAPKSNSH